MNDNDFRQFNGSFDSTLEPDSAFVERLQQRMATEAPVQATVMRAPVVASPPRQNDHVAAPRRSNPLYIAAAVLVVFALAVASIVQLAPGVLEPDYANQAVATVPADAGSTPGADVVLDAEPLPGLGSAGQYHIVDNNLVIVNFEGDPASAELVSYDLNTRTVGWRQDISSMGHVVFSDDVAVAITYGNLEALSSGNLESTESPAFPEFDELRAFDIQTGEKLWTNSITDWRMVQGWETIVMAGERVIFLEGGQLTGIDARTGETDWQAPYALHMASEDGYIPNPTLVHIDNALYLAQVNGMAETFDLTTGESIDQFSLPASLIEAHPVNMQLFPVPAGLLVTADTYAGSGALTTLIVVDPDDGDVVWERSVDQSGRVVVDPNGSIAIATYTWESRPWLLRLIGGNEGTMSSALVWIDADGETILETEPVRLPEMAPLAVAAGENYACVTADEFVCFDRAGTKYILGTDAMWGAEFVDNTLVVFTETGVMRVEFP
jgi:outer membrane protein assembly factor BamB